MQKKMSLSAMYLKPELAAFLQNNDLPSESTILEVTESLKAPLSELQEVEAEIQRLGELVEVMKMKRQNIQKIINDHNIILSPVRRLPADVLHEIFFHCLPIRHNPIVKYSECPLLLTRICSSWRAIALASPRIWSKIHIPLPGDPSVSEGFNGTISEEPRRSDYSQIFTRVMRSRCDIVRSWLSRSGTCPLSLSVTCSGGASRMQNSKDEELTRTMFDILLSFADRWSVVVLSMPEDIYHKLQGDINPTVFSLLISLNTTLHRQYEGVNTESVPIRLLAAPALRRIAIHDIQTTSPKSGTLVHQPIWNPITHITFTSPTTDRYLLILLKQCPNLVFGKFIVTPSPQWSDHIIIDKESELLLPRLESLDINDCGTYETMTIMFKAIKAPALTRLLYRQYSLRSFQPNSIVAFPIAPVIPLLENSTLINALSLDSGISSQDTYKCLQHGSPGHAYCLRQTSNSKYI